MKKLSVVVPAYNEAKRIVKTLTDMHNFLIKQSFDYEILVVDDGSLDNTVELVTNLKSQVKNLSVITNSENHGKGWVVKQGMLKATGDIRLFMDADNSTTVNQIMNMLPYFEQGSQAVIGSRRVEGSQIETKQSLIRDFLGGVFRFIVHTLVPVGVTDTQCGFKAFTGQAVAQIFSKQSIYRWAFDVEILALARKNGFKIKEVPIVWVNDAESHVKFSGMVKMLLEIIQIRINLWSGKYGK